jgi:hypothetical protein
MTGTPSFEAISGFATTGIACDGWRERTQNAPIQINTT